MRSHSLQQKGRTKIFLTASSKLRLQFRKQKTKVMEPFFQFDLPKDQSSIIKVFGVGGGGSNAVNHMHELGITGVNFVVLNTDAQALDMSRIPNKIQLGPALTQGLGAGANPTVGERAAEESLEAIKDLLNKNTKMVFITAGMGGGTGTGAAPVVARIAREMGILTVGIVTTPFWFEGKSRYSSAMEGIERLRDNVDTLLIINNDKIREMFGNLKRSEAFGHANNILTTAAKAISEIITVPGEINVDFADVQTVMKNGGSAVMGSATAEGEDRAIRAAQGALSSPLLNDNEIKGAKKVLVNITTGTQQVTMDEIGTIMEYVQETAGSTDVILGACDDPSIGEKLTVTLIATGFETGRRQNYKEQKQVKVYRLNDETETKEKETSPAQVIVDEPKPDEQVPVFSEEPKMEEDTIADLIVTEEETISLFNTTSNENTEAASENTIEFEVTKEEQNLPEVAVTEEMAEETIDETAAETVAEITEQVTEQKTEEETWETPVTEVNKEEDYVVYNKVSYETVETKSYEEPQQTEKLEDRKKVLAGLSFRISSKQNLNELENEPAYKRKNLDLNNENKFSTENTISGFSVVKNEYDQSNVKPNSFLHDNVD